MLVGFLLGEIRAFAWSVYKRKRALRSRYRVLELDLSALQKRLDGFCSQQHNSTTLLPATRTLANTARRIAEHRSALVELRDEDLCEDLDGVCNTVTEIENFSNPSFQIGDNSFGMRLLVVLSVTQALGMDAERVRQRVREKV